jgi:cation diffusion facilitator family transporter
VVVITLVTMFAEILFGWLANSMALLADGWHMGTHAFALGISLMAYVLARRFAHDRRFTFGTWKIEILGAYSSAIVLGLVGLLMIYTSLERLVHPLTIHYSQALIVAIIGLMVNLACALILNFRVQHPHEGHHHHLEADHDHHAHDDLNLKSAYLHVMADALTSVLAIAALLGAKYLHLTWLDPAMGIMGAVLIVRWSAHLLKNTSGILLDCEANPPLVEIIREQIESDGDSVVSDLHLWKVADRKFACIVSLVTSTMFSMEDYKERLSNISGLAHITIEICRCKVA